MYQMKKNILKIKTNVSFIFILKIILHEIMESLPKHYFFFVTL